MTETVPWRLESLALVHPEDEGKVPEYGRLLAQACVEGHLLGRVAEGPSPRMTWVMFMSRSSLTTDMIGGRTVRAQEDKNPPPPSCQTRDRTLHHVVPAQLALGDGATDHEGFHGRGAKIRFVPGDGSAELVILPSAGLAGGVAPPSRASLEQKQR